MEIFENGYHDDESCLEIDGEEYSETVFDTIVKQGDDVDANFHTTRTYEVVEQSDIDINIFSLDGLPEEPQYIDGDPRVSVVAGFPVKTEQAGDVVDVDFYFGGTEITAKARSKATGKEVECAFNFK